MMGFFKYLSVASLALASNVQATVSSTGFTVSLDDIDYFLPPKPVAKIEGCNELKSSFAKGLFVPITVVKGNGTVDLATHNKDDVWQKGFLEGRYTTPPKRFPN